MAFGAAVAFIYGLLMVCHIVFGLFFALSIMCTARGGMLAMKAWLAARQPTLQPVAETALAAGGQR